ncbi:MULTISPECIES: inositol monophosphatase family protein [Microbacterium]|uniref:inositol monophosphatase family protein n=1 Tax=Microbacterium TaxID=33882 RepID=UPI0006F220C1|nr:MULTISPECIES: inositol monophosphatase family protein [Microbacterium]KQP71585.1 histidinol phosphatase [Microbacterium sp. Leaf288]MDR7112198.1 histidinol-phosphatase [Microbacterium trichothecenolyticum]MDT0143012.1 inositol monophosphatase family protein [Microbacterium sp. PRC9]
MTSPSPVSTFDTPFEGDLRADLDLALRLADAADAASMSRFDAVDLDVRLKADASHVTEADLATERALRDLLETERPGDGVFGEEYGVTGDSARQWIIDPIDGTANYLKGIPMWTTLIALAIDGVPRVGVASQPAIGRRWWAASGLGAWTNTPTGETKRLAVSAVDTIADSSVSFQSIGQWRDAGKLDALERLTSSVWRDRGYGDAWPYMLLAEGRLEFVAEFGVKEYDIAALVPIVTEAGGKFTSFEGNDSLSDLSSLATNRVLHSAYLDLLHTA